MRNGFYNLNQQKARIQNQLLKRFSLPVNYVESDQFLASKKLVDAVVPKLI